MRNAPADGKRTIREQCGDLCSQQLLQCLAAKQGETPACTWVKDGPCNTASGCNNGVVDERECGFCTLGTQQRSCISQSVDECKFSDWTECLYPNAGVECLQQDDVDVLTVEVDVKPSERPFDQGDPLYQSNDACFCKAGQIQRVYSQEVIDELVKQKLVSQETPNCGTHCGYIQRVCESGCRWSEWSSCQGAGECVPGTTSNRKDADCPDNVSYEKTCQDTCLYGPEKQTGTKECAPGQKDKEKCAGKCGYRWRDCKANCRWEGSWSACDKIGAQCSTGGSCGICGYRECVGCEYQECEPTIEQDKYEPNNDIINTTKFADITDCDKTYTLKDSNLVPKNLGGFPIEDRDYMEINYKDTPGCKVSDVIICLTKTTPYGDEELNGQHTGGCNFTHVVTRYNDNKCVRFNLSDSCCGTLCGAADNFKIKFWVWPGPQSTYGRICANYELVIQEGDGSSPSVPLNKK